MWFKYRFGFAAPEYQFERFCSDSGFLPVNHRPADQRLLYFISQNCKLEIPRIVWDRLGSSGIAPGSFTGSKYVVPSVFVGFSNLCDSTEIEIPIEK